MMKRISIFISIFLLGFTLSCIGKAKLDTSEKKQSYAYGHFIGQRLFEQGADINVKAIHAGISDGLQNKHQMSEEDIIDAFRSLETALRKKQTEKMMAARVENLESSEAFLKANKSKEGIKVLASGLQYKVTKQGVGRTPKATDTVVVHYKGTLLDGTEFDSSYKRNQPAEFKVTQVIKGWTEALQKMNVGSKWTLYIPPNLAYGTQGAGRLIGPNQALIFDVELIRIK